MTRPALMILAAALLTGCVSVGPDYSRPRFDAPAQWDNASGKAENTPGLEQSAWWRRFGDPALDQLMAEAVRNNLDVAQARARIAQARADVSVSRAAAFPALNASGSTTSSFSDPSSTAALEQAQSGSNAKPTTTYMGGFDVSWELDVFGGQRRQRESSRATAEASVEDMRATVLTLIGDVARNYVELRRNQQRLAIATHSAESQAQNVDVTRERFRIGLVSQLDVSQAEAQLASTRANIPTREASVRQSIHRLGILVGRAPGALAATLSVPAPLPSPGGAYTAGLPAELLERRPDLRKAERQLAAASADIGVATAKQYPSFDLTMGLGLQGNVFSKFIGLANWYWSVIPSIAAPVFDAGKTRAGVEKNKALYDESLAKYRSAFLTALEEVENALVSISTEQQREKILRDAVKANEEALLIARERYTKGLTSFLDVLSAEKSLYDAQDDACTSSAAVLTGMITLYKALGGGWDSPELTNTRVADNVGPLGLSGGR